MRGELYPSGEVTAGGSTQNAVRDQHVGSDQLFMSTHCENWSSILADSDTFSCLTTTNLSEPHRCTVATTKQPIRVWWMPLLNILPTLSPSNWSFKPSSLCLASYFSGRRVLDKVSVKSTKTVLKVVKQTIHFLMPQLPILEMLAEIVQQGILDGTD